MFSKRNSPGTVYAVQCGDLVKIGYTRGPISARMPGLRKDVCPCRVSILRTWNVVNAVDVERAMHDRYARKCVRGEWFRLDERDIAELRDCNDLDELVDSEVCVIVD